MMDDGSGPSRLRRSSDPLLPTRTSPQKPRDRAPTLRSPSEDPVSELAEDLPPPKYCEAAGPLDGDAAEGGTREALLGSVGEGGPRKTSEDGREAGRGEMLSASIEQRKALWWKNTVVTGSFIASW